MGCVLMLNENYPIFFIYKVNFIR